MRKYVVDTCIVNKLKEGLLSSTGLPTDGQFLTTHVQIDEINSISDKEIRAQLLRKFVELAPTLVPTESFLFDISRWDLAKWSNGDTFRTLKTALDALNGARTSNVQDALIGEVAIHNGYTLITPDYHLYKVAEKYGASVLFFNI